MIVEDDWTLTCELRDQLKDFGYEVVTIVHLEKRLYHMRMQ